MPLRSSASDVIVVSTGVTGFADVVINTAGGNSTITAGSETIIVNGTTPLNITDFV